MPPHRPQGNRPQGAVGLGVPLRRDAALRCGCGHHMLAGLHIASLLGLPEVAPAQGHLLAPCLAPEADAGRPRSSPVVVHRPSIGRRVVVRRRPSSWWSVVVRRPTPVVVRHIVCRGRSSSAVRRHCLPSSSSSSSVSLPPHPPRACQHRPAAAARLNATPVLQDLRERLEAESGEPLPIGPPELLPPSLRSILAPPPPPDVGRRDISRRRGVSTRRPGRR